MQIFAGENKVKNSSVWKILLAYSLAVMSMGSHAETFRDMFMREGQKAVASGSRGEGRTVVIFHTDKPLVTTTALISSAMKMTNPDALIFKQWVPEILYRGYDEQRKCGVVIGSWWSPTSGKLGTDWERRVYSKIKNSVNAITFQYARNDTLQVLEGTPGDEGEALIELCMK
jgi:hypothetical protein